MTDTTAPGNGLTFEKMHRLIDDKTRPLVHEKTCVERHKAVDDALIHMAHTIEENNLEIKGLSKMIWKLAGAVGAVQVTIWQVLERV